MPQAIPLIIYAAGTAAALSATTVALLTLAASVAVGLYERDRAKRKARNAYNASLQDRMWTVRSATSPRQYVIGQVRVGGTLMYANTIGANRVGFDSVFAYADNVCQLVGYYIGEDYIGTGLTDKYGRNELRDVSEEFTVDGPSATVSLSNTPASGQTNITGSWARGGRLGTVNLTVTYGPGNTVTIEGIGNAQDVKVKIHYKSSTGQKLQLQFKSGTADQVVTPWPSYVSPEWGSEHRLRGVCYARALMVWDENLWPNGAPTVGIVLKGGRVETADATYPFYDPRDGSNPVYTDNPALVWAWWRTLPRKLGGMGVPSEWIDWGSVQVAANVCDELISVRKFDDVGYDQVKRYQCHTVLSTGATPAENEEIILGSMAGRKVFTAGKFRVVAGAFRPAAFTITDKDVIGTKPISVLTADPTEVPPNVVTARFSDARKNYAESEPKRVENQGYIDSDGREWALDLALPATTDERLANYLMGVALESSRPAFAITLCVGGIGENIALLDTTTLNLTNRSAYAGRTFEVLGSIDNWDGTFDLTLAEIKPTTWALHPDDFIPTNPAPLPDNSYLWNVPAITGFTIAPQTPQTLPDGTVVTRVDLSWDAPPGDGIAQGGRIQIRYRPGFGEWITLADLPGDATSTTLSAALVDTDVYQFQIRAVSSIGAAGPWADQWQQIEGTPISVRGIRLRASSILFHVPASGSGTVDPASVALTLDRTGGLTASATWETTPAGIPLGGSGDNRTLAYTDIPSNVDTVRIDVEVEQDNLLYLDALTVSKIRDGADGPDYIPDNTPPPPPTSFTASAAFAHIILEWDDPTYTVGHGHASTVVYGVQIPSGGPQPTFANAEELGGSPANVFSHSVGLGETWAYWAKHKSVDGVLSDAPAGGTNGTQATTGKIGNVDLGPLIVEAGNLATNAVTADKVAAGAILATKFASDIQPVGIATGSLPSTLSTNVITFNGELYRWNGAAYVKSVTAGDVVGSFGGANVLTNSSFEADSDSDGIADGWVIYNNDGMGPSGGIVSIQSPGVFGGNFQRLAFTSNGSSKGVARGGNVFPGGPQLNQWYVLSWYAKASGTVVGLGMGPAWNTGPHTQTTLENPALSTSWQRYAFRFRWTSGSPENGLYLTIDYGSPAAGAIDIDAVQLELGETLSAYAPKPDEILPGTVGTTQIAPNAVTSEKIVAGAIVAGKIAAGAIVAGNLAAGSVTANELAANSVVAGKIAAGAVSATEIAAGAITTEKLLVTGRGAALNDDPGCVDVTAWELYTPRGGSFVIAQSSLAPGGSVLRITEGQDVVSRRFATVPGKRYRASCWARKVSGNGVFYLQMLHYASGAAPGPTNYFAASTDPSASGITLSTTFTRYTFPFDFVANAATSVLYVLGNWTGTGVTDFSDIRCDEVIPGELIVDGAITATKLSANSIAVGTAAIQAGAIVNAMIGTAAIDDAKIANLSGAKINAGTITADKLQANSITADRLAVLSVGGTTIDMSSGRITLNNGAYMKVEGVGFGTLNQFIEWFGPTMAISSCSESNAVSYVKTNGQAYFGGSLSPGTAKTAGRTTDTSTTATITIGPFGTLGGTIAVVFSYQMFGTGSAAAGTGGQTFGISAVIDLYRTIGTGAEVLVDTLNVSGLCTHTQIGPGEVIHNQSMASSRLFNDVAGGTLARTYRATLRTRSSHHNPATQEVSIVATEG